MAIEINFWQIGKMKKSTEKSQEIFSFFDGKRLELSNHPVYSGLNDLTRLQGFMECHVFAVWDFMTLLKRLQRELTCVEIPWRPSPYPKNIVRLLNEIVLGEESDEDGLGGHSDHFTLYLKAMEQIGADTLPINRFLKNFQMQGQPPSIVNFVNFNLDLAKQGNVHQVVAAFFFGREHVIPQVFTSILQVLEGNCIHAPQLFYYLNRHIQIDGEAHGPMAKVLLEYLCQDDAKKWEEVRIAGEMALLLREELWNGVLNRFKASV